MLTGRRIFRKHLAVVLLYLFAQTSAAYIIEKIGTEQGLPQSAVRDIVQDKRGFIWVATEAGLARYDGYDFKQYLSGSGQDQYPDSRILKLHIDMYERLWLATGKGVYQYRDNSDNFISLEGDSELHTEVANSAIFTIQSTKEALWILTYTHLYKYEFNNYQLIKVPLPVIENNSKLVGIEKDELKQSLWLITSKASYVINQENVEFISVTSEDSGKNVHLKAAYYPYEKGIRFYGDGQIWCPSNEHLSVYSCGKAESLRVLKDDVLTPFVQQKNGDVWGGVTYNKGIFKLNSQLLIREHIKDSSSELNFLTNKDVNKVFIDRQQNVWIALHGGGINKISNTSQRFELYRKNRTRDGLSHNHVRTFFEENGESVWIGTYNGLNHFNPISKEVKSYFLIDSQDRTHSENFIKDIVAIDEHQLMIATAVPYKKTAFWIFDTLTTQWKPVDVPESMERDGGFDLLKIDNEIWVAVIGKGLYYYSLTSKTWHRPEWLPAHLSPKNISQMYLDSQKNLWVGSLEHGALRYNLRSKKISHYKQQKQSNGLNGNWVKSFLEDAEGNIWIGTTKGLNKFITESESFKRILFGGENIEDTVYGILQDGDGYMWASTNRGLVRFNPSLLENNESKENILSDDFFHFFHTIDGLQGEEFNTGAFLKTQSGRFYFGGTKGFNSFDPSLFNQAPIMPKPVITELRLFNQLINVGKQTEDFILGEQMHLLKELSLSYKHLLFSISFSSLNFDSPLSTKYAYRLQGLHDKWVETDSLSREATFSGLSDGKYLFQVRYQLPNGEWGKNYTELPIIISPPWWKTYWAYGVYFITMVSILYSIFQRRTRLIRMHAKQLEEQVNLRTIQLKKALIQKEQVFTNISHEFRTPLTLLLGPASELEGKSQRVEVRHLGRLIKRNGQHLLRLVNQLLGLARAEQQFNLEKLLPLSLNLLLSSISERFKLYAEIKKIDFSYQLLGTSFIEAHAEDIEQIISNLISNAFKYTRAGGQIALTCKRNHDEVHCWIKDTGIGIPADDMNHIFERFYRASNNQNDILGSGIGLALVQSLIKKTHGKISVKSEVAIGTEFHIVWSALNHTEIEKDPKLPVVDAIDTVYTEHEISMLTAPFYKPVEPIVDNKKPSILLVEDHSELREYVAEKLSKEYFCITAVNGAQGVKLAIQSQPRLIISDIMMPELDGYGMCEEIKKDYRISHIPIILLTAKADQPSRLKGLMREANAYLSKPFDFSELNLHIRNLLVERERLKKQFCLSLDNEYWKKAQLPLEYNLFLEQLNEHLENNFSSAKFLPVDLANLLKMSERQLQRKFKHVAGLTPTKFIRQWRLNRSRQLLRRGVPIGNTALDCGFGSQAYFGKCFKEHFDMTASDYVSSSIIDEQS